MNRAFFSLYGFIVVTVITVGWALDALWQHYVPASESDIPQEKIALLIKNTLKGIPTVQLSEHVLSLSKDIDVALELMHHEDVAPTQLMHKVSQGDIAVIYGSQGEQYIYVALNQPDFLVQITLPSDSPQRSVLYDVLVFVFYASIALVVFFWVWPLSRDLQKLEKYTRLVGKEPLPETLNIRHGSTVYSVAKAFYRMEERIRELLATNKEMTYAVSHELRTPLARMKFGLEMAQTADNLEDIKHRLQGIREDVTEMDDLISSLLTYASYDQSSEHLDIQTGDMVYMVSQVIMRIKQNDPENHGAPVEFTVESVLPDSHVTCEWRLMECAVINILQNAQRYARNHVRVILSGDECHYILIIEDDGEGIPEDECERVFQSFVRLTNKTNGAKRGFGLGLALVKRIMRWHHGDVLASRSELGGAKFIMSWPRQV